MALKSKRPSAGASRGGKKTTLSFSKLRIAVALSPNKPSKRRRSAAVETIEARLERKATVADTRTFATMGFGQMTREKRHKLLYGD